MSWALHFEIFAVVVVKFLERFHEQIVDWKPDGPAPVRISAKEACRGFGRLVVNAVRVSVHVNLVRMVLVVARESPHSVWRKELRFVQHAADHPLELLPPHEEDEAPNPTR